MTSRAIRRLRQPSALRPTSAKAPPEVRETHRSWCSLITIYRNWVFDARREARDLSDAPVALSWVASFDSFYQDMGPRPKGLMLRRKDAALPYSPDNCYWGGERVRGSKPRILLTHDGVTRSISQWSTELGISPAALYSRFYRGKPIAEILGFQSEVAV